VGAPLFAVAGLTIDIAVGSVASDDGVKGLGAVLALETFTMPRSSLGEDLFGGEDYAAATGTTLAGWSLDARGVDNRGLGGGVTISVTIALQGATTLTVTISFGAEFLSVTNFAVNILVRTFGDVNRIQSFGTDATFETGLVEGLNTEKTQLRRHNTCDEDSEREKRALEGLIPLQ
jgi:hypothetical protein